MRYGPNTLSKESQIFKKHKIKFLKMKIKLSENYYLI